MIALLFDFLVVFLPEFLSYVCGWIGSLVVRVITLGKVNLAWGTDLGTLGTSLIGMLFLLLLGSTLYRFL